MKKIYSLLIVLSLLSGCYRPDLDFSDYDYDNDPPKFMGWLDMDTIKPYPYKRQLYTGSPYPKVSARHEYENTNQEYAEGFQDGCQTHNSVIGKSLSRVRGASLDANKLAYSEKYLRGFRDAEAYCLHKLDWEHH